MCAHGRTTSTITYQSRRERSLPSLKQSGPAVPNRERAHSIVPRACFPRQRVTVNPSAQADVPAALLVVYFWPVVWITPVCFPAAFFTRRYTVFVGVAGSNKVLRLVREHCCVLAAVCLAPWLFECACAAALVTQGDGERGPVARQDHTHTSGRTPLRHVCTTSYFALEIAVVTV